MTKRAIENKTHGRVNCSEMEIDRVTQVYTKSYSPKDSRSDVSDELNRGRMSIRTVKITKYYDIYTKKDRLIEVET